VAAYVHVALTTGLRKEELRGLRWTDVNLIERRLTVNQVVVDEAGRLVTHNRTKTEAGHRTVSFDDSTLEAFLRQQEHQQVLQKDAGSKWAALDLVFTSPTGTPLRDKQLQAGFRGIQAAAKVSRIRLYDTRST